MELNRGEFQSIPKLIEARNREGKPALDGLDRPAVGTVGQPRGAVEFGQEVRAFTDQPGPLPEDGLLRFRCTLVDKGLSRDRREALIARVDRASRAGQQVLARLTAGEQLSVVVVTCPKIGRIGLLPAPLAEQLGARVARGERWDTHVTAVRESSEHPARVSIEVVIERQMSRARAR